MARTQPEPRRNFLHYLAISTRWMDNDVYGHVNNVVYYSYFDTVVNQYLIDEGGLDISASETIGLVVESGCQFHRELTFPQTIDAGLRVGHLGRTSVRYEIALFPHPASGAEASDDEPASAQGHFVHVFVDRLTRRPVEMAPRMRAALERLIVPPLK